MKIIYASLAVLAVAVVVVSSQNDEKQKNRHAPHISRAKEQDEDLTTEVQDPTTISTDNESTYHTDLDTPEQKKCSEMIGYFMNGKFQGLEVKHDLAKLLEKYGCAPGKVNAAWSEKEDAPVAEEDLEKRPLPEADEKYWLYKYGDTDYKSYIRTEHAVKRFSGTPKAFLEVTGMLYFTPEDFCGMSRKAQYRVDDQGFSFEVSYEYCSIEMEQVNCAPPAICTSNDQGIIECVAGPSIRLLATLVGGGK